MAGSTSSCVHAPTPSRPGAPRCCATSSRSGCWDCLDLAKLAAVTAVASKAASPSAKPGVDRGVMAVFAGLMLGSLVASLNMTLVAPALPTIVSELGGLADYSWVPISAMLASIVGPAAGGFITEHFSWRWLFFVNLPVAIVTLVVVALFMHVPNERRKHAIDVWGSVTLSTGIAAALLATVWGGTQFAWTSWQIVGLYAAAAILLGAFVWVERHAP